LFALKQKNSRLIGVESEHLERKSTTPHHLVNSNKVSENSLDLKMKGI
jgi:hypothetical protein